MCAQWINGDELTAEKLNRNRAFPSKVRAYLSAYQDLPAGADTLVAFDSEDFDLGSEFDTATHKFTAGKDGYYSIQGSIMIYKSSADWGRLSANIVKNGATIGYFHLVVPDGSYYVNIPFMDTIFLAVGDIIEIIAYATDEPETIMGGSHYTHLEISRIYET